MDIQKLLKWLRLTASEADGEALAAIRRANFLLEKYQPTWDALIAGTGIEPADYDYDVGTDWGAVIDEILRIKHLGRNWVEFLESVRAYWDANGYLSEKQIAVVERFRRCP
jgi:hypothetical protein